MEIDDVTQPATSPVHSEGSCLNCGAELAGKFCAECGQPSATERYRFASLGREVYGQLRKIDAGTTAKTFWALFRHPGEFVRSYLSGKRVGYLGPIKYFFYSFVVQILFSGFAFWLTNERVFSTSANIDLRFEIVSLVSTAFWGLLWALFYRRSELNTVENVVAAIYFVAQVNFISVVLQVLLLPFAKMSAWVLDYSGIVDTALTIGYSFYFVRTLFNERILLLVPKQLILIVLYVVLMAVTVLGDVFLRIFARQVLPQA